MNSAKATNKQKSKQERSHKSKLEADIKNDNAIDTGYLKLVGDDAWVLNPKSPLPLTVLNASLNPAKKLKEILDSKNYAKIEEILLLIIQNNLRFKEVDEFVNSNKPKFESAYNKLVNDSLEWADDSEADQDELRQDFEIEAFDSLGVSIGYVDFTSLLYDGSYNYAKDNDIFNKLSADPKLLILYMSAINRISKINKVKSNDPDYQSWIKLVEMGYARMGKNIPLDILISGLRLTDLNKLLEIAREKPLRKKSKAIDAALSLPDIISRLDLFIPFREIFQVIPSFGVNEQKMAKTINYAHNLALIVSNTYNTGIHTLESIETKKNDADYDAWEISNWEDPLPTCAKKVCRKYSKLPAKKPPYHVGCTCNLDCSFRD